MQKPYTVPLDVPLPYPEDQNLTYMTKVEEVEIYRPPGIHSLRQWGQMKLPEGKHKGKSFLETVEKDYQYAQWIDKNKSLTSDWARSFQGFVRAWNQMTMSTVQGVSTPCPMAKGKVSGKKAPGDDWSEAEEELILVQETGRSEGKLPTSSKRGYPDREDREHGDGGECGTGGTASVPDRSAAAGSWPRSRIRHRHRLCRNDQFD